jgi:hypothetical protein
MDIDCLSVVGSGALPRSDLPSYRPLGLSEPAILFYDCHLCSWRSSSMFTKNKIYQE